MLDVLFQSVLTGTITAQTMLLCTVTSLLLGLGIGSVYMFRNHYSKNFVVMMAIMPAMVQIVIMLVNGNLGAGVAVAGAFSLVRFRSVPGNSRDICTIFFAMSVGLATGMGYIGFAVLFFIIIALATMTLTVSGFGGQSQNVQQLKITIPENLDYEDLFDELLDEYSTRYELVRVRTTNMGSLYELQYELSLKANASTKALLDELRIRNGNLSIILGRPASTKEEL